MKMYSLYPFHDKNSSLLEDGEIKINEFERFSRIKHHAQFDVNPLHLKEMFSFYSDVSLVNIFNFAKYFEFNNYNRNFKEELKYDYIKKVEKKVNVLDHHLAHASYSYFTRPISFVGCDIFSIDGWGYTYDNSFFDRKLNKKAGDDYPLLIGNLWIGCSTIIFGNMGCEGKVMGMAAYGKINENIYTIMLENTINNIPKFVEAKKCNDVKPLIRKILENENCSYFDLAATLQKFTEDFILQYLKKMKTTENLCLSGGVALNGYVNQKIIDSGLYKRIHIPPACNDSGLSLGAALYLLSKKYGDTPLVGKNVAYLGNDYEIDEDILDMFPIKYRRYDYDYIYDYISNKIADGKIVGWYQGRSESGPRALGNRSILCDPSNPKMKDYLNEQVKHREWFRPFAPSVLLEDVKDWFDGIDESPYMLRIVKFKDNKGDLVPSVKHADNTARVQTVKKEDNQHFYNLIKSFKKKTGIPMVLNTSFNDQEPIVETPSDAIKTFLRTGIDILVLKDYIITKKDV